MIDKTAYEEAKRTRHALSRNNYPGRFSGIAFDPTRRYLYRFAAMMGRSDSSRNRVYEIGHYKKKAPSSFKSWVCTAKADELRSVGDEDMTIYNALLDDGQHFVVANGHQGAAILEWLQKDSKMMESALKAWSVEPDGTPRITAAYIKGRNVFELSIIRREVDTPNVEHCHFEISDPEPGILYCLHTYERNGKPLPSYRGAPRLLPVGPTLEATAKSLWEMLDPVNKVGLVLAGTDLETGEVLKPYIINKYEKVAAPVA